MSLNYLQKIIITYFVILVLFWCWINFVAKTQESTSNFLFSFLFSLTPLVFGFLGIFFSKSWGWFKSSVGRAVFFISLGSFSWGAGSMMWSYFNFFKDVAMPYPSVADVGFLLASIFWVIGIVNLSRASGAHAGSKHTKGKLMLYFIPVAIVALSYYFLVVVARGGVITSSIDDYLKLFFDLAYPIGDVVILTLALLIFSLSVNYLGGKYKTSIHALFFGFAMMYIADFVFSYTTTIGTFYVGNFGDLLFTIALFLISFGAVGFHLQTKSLNLK